MVVLAWVGGCIKVEIQGGRSPGCRSVCVDVSIWSGLRNPDPWLTRHLFFFCDLFLKFVRLHKENNIMVKNVFLQLPLHFCKVFFFFFFNSGSNASTVKQHGVVIKRVQISNMCALRYAYCACCVHAYTMCLDVCVHWCSCLYLNLHGSSFRSFGGKRGEYWSAPQTTSTPSNVQATVWTCVCVCVRRRKSE